MAKDYLAVNEGFYDCSFSRTEFEALLAAQEGSAGEKFA